MKNRLAFVTHEECLKHVASYEHPESPDRILALTEGVKKSHLAGQVDFKRAKVAKRVQIESIHPRMYIDRLRKSCKEKKEWFDFEDTFINEHSYRSALYSAGGAIEGVRLALSGKYRRVFCCVRPPGHHADREKGMGFCLMNNVAIAAKYGLSEGKLRKVMIVDWDAHHGNGTQNIFERNPSVFYLSLHEHPTFLFPGTGRRWETGKGKGAGATLNIPLPPGSGDEEYIQAFLKQVVPTLKAFRPDLLLISAGFDGHRDDTLSDMTMTEEGFGEITRLLVSASENYSSGIIVSILEGGYQIDVLAKSAISHLDALVSP